MIKNVIVSKNQGHFYTKKIRITIYFVIFSLIGVVKVAVVVDFEVKFCS